MTLAPIIDPLIIIPGSVGLVVSIIYVTIISMAVKGWKQIPDESDGFVKSERSFSVIIAFRNEELNLPGLLEDLKRQDYPSSNFEVWFVDDHSTDKGPEIIEKAIEHQSNMFVAVNEGEGKKAAIITGVNRSRHDTIITTDADIRISSGWITAYAKHYEKSTANLVFGTVVPCRSGSLFGRLQSLEYLSLMGVSAGLAQAGHAVMCNGANMSFQRHFYLNRHDPLEEETPSGDDMFLLLAQKMVDISRIDILKSSTGNVFASMEKSYAGFMHQRIRWASKSRLYKDREVIMLAGLVWLINFSLLLFAGLSFWSPFFLVIFLTLWIVKSVPDFILVQTVAQYYERTECLKYFLPVSLAYPFYINWIVFMSLVKPKFVWKDRTYHIK